MNFTLQGFFLNVSLDSILTVAKHACSTRKVFCMNLSAQFLCRIFKDNMMAAFPYIDILFGNDEVSLLGKGFAGSVMKTLLCSVCAS